MKLYSSAIVLVAIFVSLVPGKYYWSLDIELQTARHCAYPLTRPKNIGALEWEILPDILKSKTIRGVKEA